MDDDKPSPGEIVFNSYLDTLYTHPFKVGQPDEGRFFNISTRDDGSQEATLELTPRVRISFVFIREKGTIESVEIAKFRRRKDTRWFPESTERVKLSPITFDRLLGFI